MMMDLPRNRPGLAANGTGEHKIVVVGPRKVGKSALVVRFLTKRFIGEYVENSDMSCKGSPDVDGDPFTVNIQDTSEKGMRLSSVEHHFRWADAIMMVYSITDLESFRRLKETALKIIERFSDSEDKDPMRIPPLVVVGNKGDLDYVRKVPRQDGYELAEKLRCDFFEASAREGWSKLWMRSDTCSPSSDSETLGIFAGSTVTVGLVGMPNRGIAQGIRRSSTPPFSPEHLRRGRSSSRNKNDLNKSQNLGSLKRWTSVNCERQKKFHSRSNSTTGVASDMFGNTIPQVNIIKPGARQNSLPCSPTLSEEDNEEQKCAGLLCPMKDRKVTAHGGLIGRLSPRLGRRFSRNNKNDDKLVRRMFRDDNNNKQKSKSAMNSVSLGLSSSLLLGAGVGDATCGKIVENQLHSNSSSCGNSSHSSANTSATESTESLVACGQELDNNQAESIPLINDNDNSYPPCSGLPIKLQEAEFGSSEPFLYLCRGRSNRTRARSRSPSRKIISGLKRIRALASEHGNPAHSRHQCNNNGLLSVPVIRS